MSDPRVDPASNNAVQLVGRPLAPGLAAGRVCVYRDNLLQNEPLRQKLHRHDARAAEHVRIEEAVRRVLAELRASAERVERELNAELAEIFRAHLKMLEAGSLTQELNALVRNDLLTAEQAVHRLFSRWETGFRNLPSDLMRERADDVADLGRGLLRALAGRQAHCLEDVPAESVLVAVRLLPSDTTFLNREKVRAVIVEQGGPASHAALLTREMGIPAVGGIDRLLERVTDGESVLVDGTAGTVTVRPDTLARHRFDSRARSSGAAQRQSWARRHEPAVTRDAQRVEVLANVSCGEDVERAVECGADGIGLYRIEGIYLRSKAMPTETELHHALSETIQSGGHWPVTVRLLDIGGDKRPPYLDLPREDDPFLGQRGVRFLLAFPELLETQLRALLRIAREGQRDLRILIPMVTKVDDVVRVIGVLRAVAQQMGQHLLPSVGAMIETPAAALQVGALAAHADFFSVGTNDLTQFTMAAGRENLLVGEYYVESHPAVLRLLQIACQEARNKPICVCGELAGRDAFTNTLLEAGYRSLSVAPGLIPVIKDAVRAYRHALAPPPNPMPAAPPEGLENIPD